MRIFLFITSLVYFAVPYSRWVDMLSSPAVSAIPLDTIGRGCVVFLIIGVSIGGLRDRILPQFLHPLVGMISYIPESLISQVEGKRQHFLLNIIQISILMFTTKIMVKLVFIKIVSIVVVILFKSTLFTYSLVMRIANFGLDYPLGILVLLPLIKRISWYYLLVYFSICGASCVASGLCIAGALMLVWRHLVIPDLFSRVR